MRRFVLAVFFSGACSSGPPALEVVPQPERRAEVAPYPDDPGFTEVDEALPRLRFQGQWFMRRKPGGEPDLVELSKLRGERVVLEGKMLLGDPLPYKASFLVGPPYKGCVHPSEVDDSRGVVRVELPRGHLVQATDHMLLVEGVIDGGTRGEPFVVRSARVERLPVTMPVEAHAHH